MAEPGRRRRFSLVTVLVPIGAVLLLVLVSFASLDSPGVGDDSAPRRTEAQASVDLSRRIQAEEDRVRRAMGEKGRGAAATGADGRAADAGALHGGMP